MRNELGQYLGRAVVTGLVLASSACGSGVVNDASGSSPGQEEGTRICVKAQSGDSVTGILDRYGEPAYTEVELHKGLHTRTKPGVQQQGLNIGDQVCFKDLPDNP